MMEMMAMDEGGRWWLLLLLLLRLMVGVGVVVGV